MGTESGGIRRTLVILEGVSRSCFDTWCWSFRTPGTTESVHKNVTLRGTGSSQACVIDISRGVKRQVQTQLDTLVDPSRLRRPMLSKTRAPKRRNSPLEVGALFLLSFATVYRK